MVKTFSSKKSGKFLPHFDAKKKLNIFSHFSQHGVLNMDDMAEIGIPDNDRSHLMESVKDLPKASTIYDLYPSNDPEKDGKVIKKFPSVDQWLKDISLEEYKETFR